ncbi:MAG: hypothetical protein LC772_07855, partial [Chloroflexi bacterium]|nr:hypothetical protein [Chloroflexota bacterium]
CGRLSRRLALTRHEDPDKVEADLQRLVPEEDWWYFSSGIIWHGRRVCHARKPECHRCVLSDLCPSSTALNQVREVSASDPVSGSPAGPSEAPDVAA